MSIMIPATFRIEILDKERFINTIAKEYNMKPDEIYDDYIVEWIQDNIKGASSKRSNLFLIEGIDTDGWFISSINTDELI